MTRVYISHKYLAHGQTHTGFLRVGHIEWKETGPVIATIHLDGTKREPLHLLRDEPQDDFFWETQS
ncbi:MAG: hypothetical protein IT381_33060 [Deltaproteobacteria bacterium]|nr:hypothetical protein [Deltaproteobacteria bacterium]